MQKNNSFKTTTQQRSENCRPQKKNTLLQEIKRSFKFSESSFQINLNLVRYMKHFTTEEVSFEQINCLLQQKNYNYEDNNKNTLLHLLFQIFNSNIYLSINIATQLIKNDLDSNILNKGGWSPLSIAILHNQYEAVKFASCWNKKHLQKFDFNQKVGDLQFSLFHLVAIKGYTNLLYILHDQGSSLFEVNSSLQTPRQIALLDAINYRIIYRLEIIQIKQMIFHQQKRTHQRQETEISENELNIDEASHRNQMNIKIAEIPIFKNNLNSRNTSIEVSEVSQLKLNCKRFQKINLNGLVELLASRLNQIKLNEPTEVKNFGLIIFISVNSYSQFFNRITCFLRFERAELLQMIENLQIVSFLFPLSQTEMDVSNLKSENSEKEISLIINKLFLSIKKNYCEIFEQNQRFIKMMSLETLQKSKSTTNEQYNFTNQLKSNYLQTHELNQQQTLITMLENLEQNGTYISGRLMNYEYERCQAIQTRTIKFKHQINPASPDTTYSKIPINSSFERNTSRHVVNPRTTRTLKLISQDGFNKISTKNLSALVYKKDFEYPTVESTQKGYYYKNSIHNNKF